MIISNDEHSKTLGDNAVDSLIHGIEHFLQNKHLTDFKYAILHIAQSCELFLKARLAREHFMLIFERPENCTQDSRTVGIEECIKRLRSSGVQLDDDSINAFKQLQVLRNRLQHFALNIDQKFVMESIGRTIKFLDPFLVKELHLSLKTTLDPKSYATLTDSIFTYEEKLKKAQQEIQELKSSTNIKFKAEECYCPNCGQHTILYPDPQNGFIKEVECHLCSESFRVYQCPRCGGTFFENIGVWHSCDLDEPWPLPKNPHPRT